MGTSSVVIFTAVDGALRNSDSRSLVEARGAVAGLGLDEVPVVLCGVQTAAELRWLQRELGVRQPFICESGAALHVPRGYFADLPNLGEVTDDWEIIEFGPPHAEVDAVLRRTAATLEVPIVGLSDLSVEQVAYESNMTLVEAALVKRREYDEPFRIVGSCPGMKRRLFNAIKDAGYRCYNCAQIHHATGVLDPGHAVRLLISLFRTCAEPPVIVGVGDDWTDRALLQEVDAPIVVRNHTVDQTRLLRTVPTAYVTKGVGPAGWTEAILGISAA
jgi:mannosyl-3-phosphoglycerate phosphatase family protein